MTTGPTSTNPGIRHTCELVEGHTIEVLISAVGDEDTAHNVAYMRAQRWLSAHGLEAEIEGDPTAEDGYAGVYFEITVGKGDIHQDQSTPGVLDSWRWSARFDWWRKVFNRMDGRQGRHLAEVSKLRTTTYDPNQYTGEHPHIGYAGGIAFGDPQRPPGWPSGGAVVGSRPSDDSVPAFVSEGVTYLPRPQGWQSGVAFRAPGSGDIVRTTEHGIAGPTQAYPGEVVLDTPPPWLRRGMGWDDDEQPMGEGLPPGLR
jgi:hypothetical protein